MEDFNIAESSLRAVIRELLIKKLNEEKKNKGSGKKYSVLSQDCTRSDGKKGTHVLKIKPKPGKYKGRKRDSKGRVKIGCHTSVKSANDQRAAIEGG